MTPPDVARSPVRFGRIVLLAAVGLGALALAMWAGLPSIHQDEFMPIFPLTWFTKDPSAISTGLPPYTTKLFGLQFPVLSYAYLGAVKAYVFLVLHLPTSPLGYRLVELGITWLVLVLVLRAAWRLSGGSAVACVVCLAFFLADTGLVTLGILDEGNQFPSLTFGSLLFLCLWSVTDAPRVWKVLPIALVTLVGELDRVNFLWFVAAGLGAVSGTVLTGEIGRTLGALVIAVVGCALGFAGSTVLLKNYPSLVWRGMQESIPLSALGKLWEHWGTLFVQTDPFSAYHRYVDTGTPPHPALYAGWRWTWLAVWLAIVVSCTLVGLVRARRRPADGRPFLFVAAFLAGLLLVIVKTHESWAAHHVVLLKPFAGVGAGLLVACAARSIRRALVGGVAVLALASCWAGAQAWRDMRTAPPLRSGFEVGFNQVDAWRAAAATGAHDVYALDWGVFYPGVVNSPPTQRWEAPPIDTPDGLRTLDATRRGAEMVLLFRTTGSCRWLLESDDARQRYGVLEEQTFDRHPGDFWTLLRVNLPYTMRLSTPVPLATPETSHELLTNGDFASGTTGWVYEHFEQKPGTTAAPVERCDVDGMQRPCVRLVHRIGADSRYIQPFLVPAHTIVEISAWARAEGVDAQGKGVHLDVMDVPRAQSEDLHGTTGWQHLRFYVANPLPEPRPVRLAVRLGTFGSLVAGTASFADVSVRPATAVAPASALFEIRQKPE